MTRGATERLKSCEFAIVVADEWQKRGIGAKRMESLIKHAQFSHQCVYSL
jgi:GNAT superfamily N-acetyltransferase